MKQELLSLVEQIHMLPETVRKIEEIFHDPASDMMAMADAIKQDPLISSYILKTANSPLYGMSRTITDVSHAVSLLGREMVRTFAIASAANNAMPIDLTPYGITTNHYLRKAQLQNALVSRWVSKVDRKHLSYLSLASFLLELGKVVISQYLITTNQSNNLAETLKKGVKLENAEIEACGSKAEDVTATIFNRWNFDPDLVHLIRFANEPEDASDPEIQEMAKFLKVAKEAISIYGDITDETLHEAQILLEEYQLDPEPFNEVIEKLRATA